MASLGKIEGGGRDGWRIRFTLGKRRLSITLSGVDESHAKIWLNHIEHLVQSAEKNRAPAKATTAWTGTLTPAQLDKLCEKGLIAEGSKPVKKAKSTELGEYMAGYIQSRKSEIKLRTFIGLSTVAERLNEYFTPQRDIAAIQATEARKFRVWLEHENKRDKRKDEKGNPIKVKLSAGTVRRYIGRARQFFKQAVEDGLIDRNPFAGQTTTVKSNKERQRYIEMELFSKVLSHAPNARWRALLVLARLGALRVPSEVKGLRWADIAWEAKCFTVRAPKTEHHEGRDTRVIPLFPDIETELLKLFVEATSEFVFPGIDGNTNLRSTLEKIIKSAGVKQWPKLWQNLRASGATDLARTLPSPVAAEIFGHTEQVAREHYWTVTDSDFDQALASMPKIFEADCGHNCGHNEGHLGATEGISEAASVSPESSENPEKPRKKQRFAAAGSSGQKVPNIPRWN